MASNFHSNQYLMSMLDDADDHDVIIQVGENQNIKEFRAHSNILKARSHYFKNAFSFEWVTKKDNMIEFQKPNIDPLVFEMILRYIYTSEVDLTKQSGTSILGLLVASDELLLEELFKYVQDYLIEKQSSKIEQNFVNSLHVIFKIPGCKKLQDHCLNFMCADPQSFITKSLDKDILFSLLKREDLQIEEIVMWDFLIKWGIEQTPGLGNENSDMFKWDNKNCEELKDTLKQFIPLIRFSEISSADFFDKVRPYKSVISHNIYEEVMEFYMKNTLPKITFPPRTGIESNLIKSKDVCMEINLIVRKVEKKSSSNKKYKFDLLYRGSRDGISVRAFLSNCNNQGPCLVLIKQNQSTKIHGGYSPLRFADIGRKLEEQPSRQVISRRGRIAKTSIFSFENGESLQNMRVKRGNINYNVDYEINEYGLDYGFDFDSDFVMSGQHVILDNSCYSTLEEIEIFKIITS